MKDKLFTSINSGKFKGKKLLLPSKQSTRSTKSIVRQCVFNVLNKKIKDSVFIEVFAGSALMAAMALSNYAKKSIAIELDKKAYEVALQNAKSLQSSEISVINGDSFLLLEELVKKQEQTCVLYFDPPFNIRENFKDIYEKSYELIQKLDIAKIKTVVLEHYYKHESPEKIGLLTRYKMKKFGKSSLSFYECLA